MIFKSALLTLLTPLLLMASPSLEKKLEACERGNFMLCYTIANEYLSGMHGENKHAEAVKLYEKTCSLSCADSCTGLGLLFSDGRGIGPSREKAEEFLTLGCERGSPFGCMALADLHVKDNKTESAKKLLEKACLKMRFQPACDARSKIK